ncbi:MAG: N-acetylglucosamine-6-phosphate deacetylase [Dysgonamonadaceae bacterium]|jgi:N-acetylglucosamine-6-phosphate deacetylase|nr:N-acetylglucosamine-6-phosphate deacetylase [Dysgonamonadaceae bacterium]
MTISKKNLFKIINGKIITPYRVIPTGCVCIENDKIYEIGEKDIDFPDAEIIDAQGNYISPGFIDLHTHGAGGSDFMDGTVEAFLQIVETHAKYGVTGLYPTTLASTNEELFKSFEIYRQAKALNTKGAAFLGFHLEGPYFSMNQRGAQDPRYIRNLYMDDYLEILNASNDIARWSSAPELDGSKKFAETLVSRGVLPAIAHSDAVYEDVVPAFDWGFTHVTHLYSGMSGVCRRNGFRYAGIIEASYLLDGMTVEIIADGIHLPASLLQLIYKIKGPGKIALITDSMRAAGMPEGKSILGSLNNGQEVIVEDGVAKMPDRTSFAGSVATADRLVRTMLRLAGTALPETIQMITITPARIMGIDKTKGSLTKGKDADVVIFDEDINIKMTMVNGKIVYDTL